MGANDKAKACIDTIKQTRKAAGLSFANFGIQAQAQYAGGSPERWRKHAGLARWAARIWPSLPITQGLQTSTAILRVASTNRHARLVKPGIQRHKRIKSCGQLVQVAGKNWHHQLIDTGGGCRHGTGIHRVPIRPND